MRPSTVNQDSSLSSTFQIANIMAYCLAAGRMSQSLEILSRCAVIWQYITMYRIFIMYLTIAELARAVEQKESFVRQHVNRRHLNVERNGRNVLVALDEAVRWARERRLPLTLPAHVSIPAGNTENRVARITVLSWQTEDSKPVNLLTLIRHRRRETLGPWASDPDGIWSNEVVLSDYTDESEEFRFHHMDVSLEECQDLIDNILDEGKLGIDGVEIDYSLERVPRRHWAYRDERPGTEHSFRSPFSKHSADIAEYWSFVAEPRKRWMRIAESCGNQLEPLLKKLGFPLLNLRPDRVGNFVLAGAEDTLYCELSARNADNSLALSVERVDEADLQPGTYTASVWASHSGDDVLRCEVAVTQNETAIDLQSEVDHIGFAIYRNSDRQCIDYMDTYLIMSISIAMVIGSDSTIELRDRRRPSVFRFNRPSSRSILNIEPSENSAALDSQIRRELLDRNTFRRTMDARREIDFGRFEPDQYREATKYFLGLLRRHSNSDEPIYLADPYFMSIGPGDAVSELYLRIFEATAGRTLQILCSPKEKPGPIKPWWSNYPPLLTGHVTLRKLFKSEYETAFHDRYLVTADSEILISNSFTGWRKDGVTFVGLPYGVYRAQAEKWWSLDPGMTPGGISVHEVK